MKQIIKKILYISTFSLIFILLFSFFNTNATEKQEINTKTAKIKEYKNINIQEIAQVGVAITTNIGMGKTTKDTNTNLHINNEILDPEIFYTNKKRTRDLIIKNNMLFLQEYYNISKADFNKIIKNSNNKKTTVNNLIKQLQIRYKNANNNLNTLKKQKQILLSEYEKINNKIETLKKKIELHFNKTQSNELFSDIDIYYILKEKQTIIKTNIIFINNFIKKYNTLINYNGKLIETIILNKDALIKNSYVVIPKSGTKTLKEFELLYNEEEFKNIKKAK